MSAFFQGVWGRAVRSVASVAIGAAVAHYQDNAWYLSLTPFLQTLSKWGRDKWPGSLFEILPF